MKKLLSGFIAIMAVSLVITGCTKTAAPPAEQTADLLVYSLVIKPNQWTKATDRNNAFYFFVNRDMIPQLGQNINGYQMLVYFSTDANSYGDPGAISYDRYMFYSAHSNADNGVLQCTVEDSRTPAVAPNRDVYVKVVVSEGAQTVRLQKMPDKTYNTVKAVFNLKD